MVLQFLFPITKCSITNLFWLCRVYMSLTAFCLLSGNCLVSAILSGLCATLLHGSSKKIPTKDIEHYFIVSVCSAGAALASSTLLWVASKRAEQEEQDEQYSDCAFSTWLSGMLLQKGLAVVLVYKIYCDLFSPKKCPFQRRKRPRRRQELCRVHVRIVRGRNLIAKDQSLLGVKTTSDPYVVSYLGRKKIGKTSIIRKSLNPTWPQAEATFQLSPVVSPTIECRIFDHDALSTDDPMGTVYVPVPPLRNTKVANWYKVKSGQFADTYCENAKGELLVEIEVQTAASEPQ